jgi:hypothetical protein
MAAMAPYVCKKAVWETFHECPNTDAAAAAAALYAFMTLASLGVTVKTRAWFMLFVPITGALESIGFGMRIAYVNDPAYIKLVIMQCFLIIPPVLLAICDYTCVGRLLSLTDPARHPPAMRRFARWVAVAYTASDFFCLALQGGGGGMLASNDPKTIVMGTNLLLAGLALQLAFFSSFTIIAIYVHRSPRFGLRGDRSLLPVWIALYATILLMFGRNIFRVIEFAQVSRCQRAHTRCSPLGTERVLGSAGAEPVRCQIHCHARRQRTFPPTHPACSPT